MDCAFICANCNHSFIKKNVLITHIKKCNPISNSNTCTVCFEDCGSSVKLKHHLISGHNRFRQPNPECDICGNIFANKIDLSFHMAQLHIPEQTQTEICYPTSCSICHKSFITITNLRRHLKHIHNQHYTCELCFEQFEKKFALVSHMRSKHKKTKKGLYICKTCNKSYISKANLTRHYRQTHETRVKYACKRCPKFYYHPSSLRTHVNTNHLDKKISEGQPLKDCLDLQVHDEPLKYRKKTNGSCGKKDKFILHDNEFSCSICNDVFKEEPLLLIHLSKKHAPKYLYEYCKIGSSTTTEHQVIHKCKHCSDEFTSMTELNIHVQDKHIKQGVLEHQVICKSPESAHPAVSSNSDDIDEAGRYKCPCCNRFYHSETTLQNHVNLKHSAQNPTKCEHCDTMCKNKHYLLLHVKRNHSSENKFQCDYCNKIFKLKRNIKTHIEDTHFSSRKYKCIECSVLCKRPKSLRKHIRTRHPNSVIFALCEICNLRFESAKSCKIHMKLLHSIANKSYPCSYCAVTLNSKKALKTHTQKNHADQFWNHLPSSFYQANFIKKEEEFPPYCILCSKAFSTKKSLKRHTKKFHNEFDVLALVTYGSQNRDITVQCDECLKVFNDNIYADLYKKHKNDVFKILFKCKTCKHSYYCLEYGIMRFKLTHTNTNEQQTIMSALCTAELDSD